MSHNLKSIYNICVKNELIPKDTTYKEFFTTLNTYHREISDKIMKSYIHKPNEQLGSFNVIRDIRRGKTINWGESNKLKDLLIKTGKVPYNKETAPDGEMWHIYYTDNDYFKWKWFKEGATQYLKNAKYYVFRACSRNRRTVGKVIKEDQLIAENYVTFT